MACGTVTFSCGGFPDWLQIHCLTSKHTSHNPVVLQVRTKSYWNQEHEDVNTGSVHPLRGYCIRGRFDEKENVSNCIQLKTSVIKGIKNQLIDQFPVIEPWLNQIMPKKDPVKIVRCHEHIEILTVNGELLFFRQREGIFYPTLRLLHKYPFILPHQQVDKGAIKFVLSGANIMCPGLTSPGAKLYPAAVDTVVAIMAEGKQHALCVGVMKMSAEDIEKVNKGIGIENIHYLNDGLWHMKTYK
ncbi:malignant T-cell-amplified sequence 1 isoform X2 [Rhea pennata]|uniref:malignant T-cell-amplified sequence 1 isoform X2 n=1 Tax=Rhea pennata TaxID=8795 RepID=UPI002E2717AB